ncbi:MAG: helix-turn-helix domain-containing protein [Oscillospiraceae bacterium]|jgi:AraC-like DNA-binding protein/ligand-binding sensor protein|nr:helix-turn-helix domain-containing protein [Oscillospiraceae bacterium]
MTPELLEVCEKYQDHFSSLLDVGCKIVDVPEYGAPRLIPLVEAQDFCANCSYKRGDELPTHLYGCHEARRWDGLYIYYCPLGLTFVAAALLSSSGDLMGGLILGPIVMGDMQDVLYDLPVLDMAWAVSKLSVFSTKKVRHISEILCATVSQIPARVTGVSAAFDKERAFKEIYDAKKQYSALDARSAKMLLRFEKEMRLTVLSGDKTVAMEMINEVLAHIYVYSNYDTNAIRARLLELLVILSRAAIEAGADPGETFRMSEDYIHMVEKYQNSDNLALRISDMIRQFMVQAFDLARAKHSDVVFRVTNYIKRNCAEKLALDMLAKEVFLSKSYLSSIFKHELGISVTSYIMNVRVEKSKRMLLENKSSLAFIATQCGFKDQSYFTKVFKKATGLSPRKFKTTYLAD